MARLSTMYKKKKGLAMNCENIARIYAIETKIVSLSLVARGLEKKAEKNRAQLH